MTTRAELGEGPTTVEGLLDGAVGPIDEMARAVRARPVDLVVIAARGTSDHAAIYAQYILGTRNGLAFINRLSERYVEAPYPRTGPREIFVITPDRVRAFMGRG